ncbi:MAG: hypothetical protein ACOZJX_08880 [Pseudomonadota bacterium]
MQRKFLLTGLLAAAIATPALAAGDKFDRADLGSKWVVTSGSLFITSNQLRGSDLGLGYFTKASAGVTGQAVVQLNGTSLQYGAVALGDIASGNNAFVKIQSQDGAGLFDHGGFYVGNNVGVLFFTLDAPIFSPATMKVTFNGSVATLKIKSVSGTQTYQYDYGTTFGTGAGLGTYGSISLDNFKSKDAAEDVFGPAPRKLTFSDALDLSL